MQRKREALVLAERLIQRFQPVDLVAEVGKRLFDDVGFKRLKVCNEGKIKKGISIS